MSENPVKCLMYWWDDRPDEMPAERVCKNELEAKTWASERSKGIRGRIELYLTPSSRTPFASYKQGVDTVSPETQATA